MPCISAYLFKARSFFPCSIWKRSAAPCSDTGVSVLAGISGLSLSLLQLIASVLAACSRSARLFFPHRLSVHALWASRCHLAISMRSQLRIPRERHHKTRSQIKQYQNTQTFVQLHHTLFGIPVTHFLPFCSNSISDFATVDKHEMNFSQLFTDTAKPYCSEILVGPNASQFICVLSLAGDFIQHQN